jgi:hypothetical protein
LAGITAIIDPEDVPLEFVADEDGIGFHILSPLSVSTPQAQKQWAGNADSEGPLPVGETDENMEIKPKLRITGRDEADFRSRQLQLEQKYHKLKKEGGILRLLYPDESWIDYAIRDVSGGERLFDNRFVHYWRTEDEVTFVCAPFGLGQEELVGEYSGSARALEIVVDEVGGSAEALARAEIVSPNADLWELLWSRDSRYFEGDETAEVLYAAKDLTPLGGAAVTTATVDGKAGVSVVRVPLTPNWTAGLSTTLAGVGPLTHQGAYDWYVWLHMPASNAGEVAIQGVYGLADLSVATEMNPTYFEAGHTREGRVVRLKVGQVWLRPASRGEHQWEGRLVFKSSVPTDVIDVLDVALRPVEELNGQVAVAPALRLPPALMTRDEFEQAGGNLNGKAIAAAVQSVTAYAGAAANVTGSGTDKAWGSLSSATGAPNKSSASAVLLTGEETNFLELTQFGLSVPVGATVEGIVVDVTRNAGAPLGEGELVKDFSIKLLKAGTRVGDQKASYSWWPATSGLATYGDQNNKWGTTWTAAEVNAAGFGVSIAAKMLAPGGSFPAVDAVKITVFYSVKGAETWATSGDAADFAVDEAEDVAKRSEVNDASLTDGRYAAAGTTVTSDVVAGVRARRSGMTVGAGERARAGALARYVDVSNWLWLGLDANAAGSPVEETLRVFKRVAGAEPVELGRLATPTQYGVFRAFYLQADRRGRWFAWGALQDGGIPRLLMAGQDNDLAAGGALDDGKNGFYGVKTGGNACTLSFDDFVAWVPPLEAVAFEGRTLEVSHASVEMEAIDGGRWISLVPEVDYLKLAPSGMENRKNRLVFIASPHDPDLMGVGFPSELKVVLYATPRYRGVPDPA